MAGNIVPNDGPGPRGLPDSYHTPRVLQSTFRYLRFIKKLRAEEEEQRRGIANNKKEQKDKEFFEFFSRCDRRNVINQVQHRVDLCLAAYEQDLQDKRIRLKNLLKQEEENFVRQLVEGAQAGAELVWQEKQARLAYLLAKRKKELQDKYTDTHLSKCSHVYPCLIKHRAKEAQEIQLYQMREKSMRKMAEAELEKMWYDVAMKESDALATRMELDEIARLRRTQDCLDNSNQQLEQRRLQRERDQARLKQEMLEMNARIAEEDKQEEQKQRDIREKRDATSRDREEFLRDRNELLDKTRAEDKLIEDTWSSLAGQGIASDKAEIERKRQIKRDLDVSNRKMVEMKHRVATVRQNDQMVLEEGQRIRDIADLQRCQCRKELERRTVETAKFNQRQGELKKLEDEEDTKMKAEYYRRLQAQIDELVKHNEMTNAQARKLYQRDLLDQIEYNNLLKTRAKKEEEEQYQKGLLSGVDYIRNIKDMMSRPYFSEHQHPFIKASIGLKLPPMSDCTGDKPKYCVTLPTPSSSNKI